VIEEGARTRRSRTSRLVRLTDEWGPGVCVQLSPRGSLKDDDTLEFKSFL